MQPEPEERGIWCLHGLFRFPVSQPPIADLATFQRGEEEEEERKRREKEEREEEEEEKARLPAKPESLRRT